MKEWIIEQIKFGRTICLYDSNWYPIFKINPIKYNDTLLNFIQNEFDPTKHHLLGDNHNLYGTITSYNYYTHYPNINNPLEIYQIYNYLNELEQLLTKPNWRSLGKQSEILPNEIMDVIWNNYSNLIANSLNYYLNIFNQNLDYYYKNYYIYCLLCWIEKNFDLIFSKFDYTNTSVIKLLENINDELCKIKKRDFSFEIKCPQIKELLNKWENNIFFNPT
jgi:hypothetical protein